MKPGQIFLRHRRQFKKAAALCMKSLLTRREEQFVCALAHRLDRTMRQQLTNAA